MKALVLAVALAVSAPLSAASSDNTLSTPADVHRAADSVATVCAAWYSGKMSSEKIIKEVQIDSPDKMKSFVLLCEVFKKGVEVGIEYAPKTGNND